MAESEKANSISKLGAVAVGDLRLPKLSHIVAARLRGQIVNGQILPGSHLPPEAELLSIFKVSRPTLREALRLLEAEALITIGRGGRSGAYVTGPNVNKAGEYAALFLASARATLSDLHDARWLFEPAIVQMIGEDPAEETITKLRDCISMMEAAIEAHEYTKLVACTNQFHAVLVDAAGNQAVTLFIRMMQSVSDDTYVKVLSDDRSRPETLYANMKRTVTGYRTLCNLLEKGKADEASAFWRRYMEGARDFLKRSGLGQVPIVYNESFSSLITNDK